MSDLVGVDQVFFYTALSFGTLFFFYAVKYYASILLVLFGSKPSRVNGGNGKPNGNNRLDNIFGNSDTNRGETMDNRDQNRNNDHVRENGAEPFISIHLPFYNERNVARRVIQACTSIDYSNFEMVVLDDSRDETIDILKELGGKRGRPTLKIVHRKDRRGFKGGALAEALRHMDPRAGYVMVFDADFIPPPSIIRQFLSYFEGQNSGKDSAAISPLNFSEGVENERKDGAVTHPGGSQEGKEIAAVQGYQLHHLNKRENWITWGVRAEYSGSYMIERVAEEFSGAMKMISGSVFMLRADVARKLGWSTSITEDWELTLRLYLAGYKVIYTPLVQAPAEIPTTIRRLIRQRMRWAEGHTFCVKKRFWEVLRSPALTFREKLEFIYFAPYYLQPLFLLLGSLCWVLAELSHCHPPFWTAALGWSLIAVNFLALPLMSMAGLFLERSVLEDSKGVLSFIVLSYLLAPFQTFAALKGLLERREGTWVRTPKTGSITDKVLQIRFRRLMNWVMPKSQKRLRPGIKLDRNPKILALVFLVIVSSPIVLVTVVSAIRLFIGENGAAAPVFKYIDSNGRINHIMLVLIAPPISIFRLRINGGEQ